MPCESRQKDLKEKLCGPRKYPYPTTEGHWKFRGEGGGGLKRPKFSKESMSLNWNFQRGGGFKPKIPSVGTHCDKNNHIVAWVMSVVLLEFCLSIKLVFAWVTF